MIEKNLPEVEPGLPKNKGQGSYPMEGNLGQSKEHMHPQGTYE